MTERLVVVGGGAAGMSAASAARRQAPDLEIVVAEATGHAGWGLCGLPYYLSAVVAAAEDLRSYPPEFFRQQRRIDLRLHTRVEAIDPDQNTVTLRHDGRSTRLGYSTLVVAAGGMPVRPALSGLDDDRVFVLRTLEEAQRLRARLDAGRIGRALVVGAGYIGLEVADALSERGCQVIEVELLDRVLPSVDREVAALVEDEVRRHVDLRLGVGLSGVTRADDGLVAHLADGTHESVDAVVLAVGVRPAGSLAAGAGASTGPGGALLVDGRQRTSLPGVLAAGDCVAAHHRVLGVPAYVPLAPAANRMGRVAGTVAAGGDAQFPGVVGTAVVKTFDLHVARTGLSMAEAGAAGINAVATDVVHRSRAKYYPGSEAVHIRLVQTAHGRLLGGQVVSRDAAAVKRVDVLATALHAGLAIHDLADLDLAYAPPHSPVHDPVVVAARGAIRSLADTAVRA